MRAISSVASVTIHFALGAAVLFGTAKSGRSNPPLARQVVVVFPQPLSTSHESNFGVPIVSIASLPDVPSLQLPSPVLQPGAPNRPVAPLHAPPNATSGNSQPFPWIASFGDVGPEVLTGPLPTYPEFLRRAGVEGEVVLEALVDTTGRVQAASIAVIAATNPGFIAPARQALLATLFRPAQVGGRPVRMLVRVPFAFTMRGAR